MSSTKKSSTNEDQVDEFLAHLSQTHSRGLDERLAAGKALRRQCSRKSQAEWKSPADRADPIDLLIENSRGRIEDLIPIRYGRMAANPFAFYRGAAAIMACDLSHTPSTGLNLQICGDCHLLNFGGFATAERRVIFDINDFDETSIAPWEWDVKRLTASFVIAGRSNGFKDDDSRQAAWLAAQSYRQSMWEYASMPVLQAWYEAADMEDIIAKMKRRDARYYTSKLDKATDASANEKEFAKLAIKTGKTARIIDQPPLVYHLTDTRSKSFRANAEQAIESYLASLSPERRLLLSRYKLADVAIKVVGVGSVGTYCGVALFMSGNGDPLLIQLKQGRQSVLEPYAGTSPFSHAGQRVVVGQRLMQAAGDMLLGWYTDGAAGEKIQFYARQLKDAKIKPVVEIMAPVNLKNYATLCGRTLARAHSRSGDAAVMAGYMGKGTVFEGALADFAISYADQNELDHAALLKAIRSGRLEARMEE